ncbi:MAG: adenylate/guanylate cyclase domain-containing protein, partial [Actinomycetota bacterium]
TCEELIDVSELPTGIVTFLFTDIQGSTRLLHELGDRYGQLLNEHHRILREVLSQNSGVEVGTEGDAFFVVFAKVTDAVGSAAQMQRALAEYRERSGIELWVRMGLHTGEAQLVGDNYGGLDVHRAARISSAGHGGQVLLSATTANHVLGPSQLDPGVRVLELGAFRLKDLADPEQLFQLCIEGLPSEFPPPAGLGNPLHLPPSLDEFVPRERELTAIGDLISVNRLVTLTGPGGTGKTRLALEVARMSVADFPDGIFFVGLAAIVDPSLMPSTVAGALALREEGARPVIETIKDHLRQRRILLLLDNFEQVVSSAPSLSELLRAAPDLKLIVTSRTPLMITGEHEYPVPPMSLPDPLSLPGLDVLAGYESTNLFLQRARSVKPDFAITEDNAAEIAEICVRLDGLPLAIELAAARARLLSPGEILARLDRSLTLLSGASRDVPQRQRTLMDAIGWSYELLDSDHQALFRRLGVFRGGWTLESAEAVADPEGDLAIETIDALELLVSNSLVRVWHPDRGETRFMMLQTIREYALRTLEQLGELEKWRARHADYFAGMAREAEPEIFDDDHYWLDRLDLDHDNLRAALRHLIDAAEVREGLVIATRLWRFWQLRSHLAEGRAWLTEVLALPVESGDRGVRASALLALGSVSYWQNDFPPTRAAYREALEIFESVDDRRGIAEAQYNLGFLWLIEGDTKRSLELHERSLATYSELGDEENVAFAKWGLSMSYLKVRELEKAKQLAVEVLDTFERLSNWFGKSLGEFVLLQTERIKGNYDRALELNRESILARESQKDLASLTSLIELQADLEISMERLRRGLKLGAAAARMRAEYGGGAPPPLLDLEAPRARVAGMLPEDTIESIWEEGGQMSVQEALAYALKDPGADE